MTGSLDRAGRLTEHNRGKPWLGAYDGEEYRRAQAYWDSLPGADEPTHQWGVLWTDGTATPVMSWGTLRRLFTVPARGLAKRRVEFGCFEPVGRDGGVKGWRG